MDVSQRSPQSIFISLMSFLSVFKSFCLSLNLPLHSDSFTMAKEIVKKTKEFTICFLRLYIIQPINNTNKNMLTIIQPKPFQQKIILIKVPIKYIYYHEVKSFNLDEASI